MKRLRSLLVLAACSALSVSLGCGGGSSSTSLPPNTIAPVGTNVAPISVNVGPAISDDISSVNAAFVAVTVCVPGTSNCQTVNDVLVDTGSFGLRILSSALMISLPQLNSASGSPVAECLQFLDSYTWGPVQTADIQIAGEKASSVPIQVLSDTDFTVPSACTGSGLPSADTVQSLVANGLLGVGLFAQDCGTPSCPASANMYFQCPSTGCAAISQSAAQQVQNPVPLFATDKDGVIIELPAAPGAEATLTGSLVFGIGTQSNNALGGATVYAADPNTGNFTTSFNGQTFTDNSFIDSGSNGYFFPDSGIPVCTDILGFYCPSSTQNLSAANQGMNGANGTVNFSIANADSLFSNASDSVFGDLGGPTSTGSGSSPTNYFDWGLPFFYGRNVYVAIEGTNAPTASPPYWAY